MGHPIGEGIDPNPRMVGGRGVAPHIFESEEEATGAVHDTLARQD